MLSHRGPDYCGSYSALNVFLGHARLSILDLTPAGNQPFGDDSAQLVFNGEIYNWKQLYVEHFDGHPLNSKSDTEVFFLLLQKLGLDCLHLLNGMFSFAYYVYNTRTLVLGRDITGIKPLHYIADGTSFEFSSEIKNLDYIPDLNRLKEYLVFGRFGQNCSPYANVKEVHPGHYIQLNCATGGWIEKPYRRIESLVDIEKYETLSNSSDLVNKLDVLLQRSVALHEQSDAPIGFLCSGGLDSSLITAIAAKHYPNMALYHADFDGNGSELSYAQRVAQHVGAPLRLSTMTKSEFWRLFPELTYSLDLPLQYPHSVSLNLVAQKARADGLKVLIAGEGADELFLGYWFYPAYKRSLTNYRTLTNPRRLISKGLRQVWRTLGGNLDPYWFFGEIDRSFQEHAHVGFGGDAGSVGRTIRALSLVGQDFSSWKQWQRAIESFEWMKNRSEAHVLSFQLFYMQSHLRPLLHRLDRMLMHQSIEGRVPYLESDLIQFGLNLPVKSKLNGCASKYLLKQVALRYLPANIVERKKVGFTVPFANYLAGFPKILEDGFVAQWAGLTKRELVNWCEGDLDELYRLLSIEVWGRIFVHKIPWMKINVEGN